MTNWKQAQKWEGSWWDTCQNTYNEEQKQLIYAEKMGLVRVPDKKTPYRFDLKGISVLDIGGGPVSLLLKCVNVRGKVVDSLEYPDWVAERYKTAGIEYERIKGEDLNETGFDEIWIYNVLEHTENPEKIIQNAKKAGKLIRIFEWVDTNLTDGHIHTFNKQQLDEWLGGRGKVENFSRGGAYGQGYYGIFPTN